MFFCLRRYGIRREAPARPHARAPEGARGSPAGARAGGGGGGRGGAYIRDPTKGSDRQGGGQI